MPNSKGDAMTDEDKAAQSGSDAARDELRKPSVSPAAIKVLASGIGSAAIVAALIFARRSTKPDPTVHED